VQVRAEATIGSAPGAIVGVVNHGTQGKDNASAGTRSAGSVDLMIMATHGRGGIGRLVPGSVADYVLPHVQVPALLVHPEYLNV
jgi:nucleotide-binding universal stress UspA family protein